MIYRVAPLLQAVRRGRSQRAVVSMAGGANKSINPAEMVLLCERNCIVSFYLYYTNNKRLYLFFKYIHYLNLNCSIYIGDNCNIKMLLY